MDLKKDVWCGFRKWSMAIGKNGEVIVKFCYHPHYGEISLHDASQEDFRKLGAMFIQMAESFDDNKTKAE